MTPKTVRPDNGGKAEVLFCFRCVFERGRYQARGVVTSSVGVIYTAARKIEYHVASPEAQIYVAPMFLSSGKFVYPSSFFKPSNSCNEVKNPSSAHLAAQQ